MPPQEDGDGQSEQQVGVVEHLLNNTGKEKESENEGKEGTGFTKDVPVQPLPPCPLAEKK